MDSLYDRLGTSYGETRRADDRIVEALAALLPLSFDGAFLDVGCGTGNYTKALSQFGGDWHGADISETMLSQARRKSCAVTWKLAEVESLPYEPGTFSGVICINAIHFFDRARALLEINRVILDGRFVIFIPTSEQLATYWLNAYFPEMLRGAMGLMPSEKQLTADLERAGFELEKVERFHVDHEIKDYFLYSGKHQPHLYLDDAITSNISQFRQFCSASELDRGRRHLLRDLNEGRFAEVMAKYASDAGDCSFFVGAKR